jgi:hypothetical protein
MSRSAKLVAIIASMAVFVMPAATMPLHCTFGVPSGQTVDPCHMAGMSSSAGTELVNSTPFDHSCCQASAPKPESLTASQSSTGKGILAPATTNVFLVDLSATPALREVPYSTMPSHGGLPQAVLCTFLI